MIDAQAVLLPIAIFASMIGIGVELELRQFRVVVEKPLIPVLGTLVHTLTFPVLAIILVTAVTTFDLPLSEPLLIGILLVAACPSGGFSNILVLVARADLVLSVVLTTLSSLLSFFTVPALVLLFGLLLPAVSGTVAIPVGETLLQLFFLVLLPVVGGMLWRGLQPAFVIPNVGRIQRWTQVFLYVVIVVVLVQRSDEIMPVLPSAMPWAVGLCFAALFTGFVVSKLVGLTDTDAATVAIEGSIRNLAVAFLIAANVLGRVDVAVLPSVYFGAVLIVGFGFAHFWRRRSARSRDA